MASFLIIISIYNLGQYSTRSSCIYIEILSTYEPEQSISYNVACAISEDSDQLHNCAVWYESLQGTIWVAKDSEDSDQMALLHRLIWVFAGHTCNLVGNAVARLNGYYILFS